MSAPALTVVGGVLAAPSTGSSSGSGGGAGFIVIAVLAIGALALLSRSRNKQRAAYADRMQDSAKIGSEVMTTAGIYGTVVGSNDEQVLVEIAPGVEVRFAKAAIARVISADELSGQTDASDDGERLDPSAQAPPHEPVQDDPDPPEHPPAADGDTRP